MNNELELQAELLDEFGTWVPGVLSLSPNRLVFQGRSGKVGRSFQTPDDVKVERVFIERQKFFHKIQETCIKVTITGKAFTFHIKTDIRIEEIKQVLYRSENHSSILETNIMEEARSVGEPSENAGRADASANSIGFGLSEEASKASSHSGTNSESHDLCLPPVFSEREEDSGTEAMDEERKAGKGSSNETPGLSERKEQGELKEQNTVKISEIPSDTVACVPNDDISPVSITQLTAEASNNDGLQEAQLSEAMPLEDGSKSPHLAMETEMEFFSESGEQKYEPTTELPDMMKNRTAIPVTYKMRFFRECNDFALACSERIPEKRTQQIDKSNDSFVFDVMNVGYMHMDEPFQFHFMNVYMSANGKLIRCHSNGIYQSDLFTAYDPFLPEPSAFQSEIIRRSIRDSVTSDCKPTSSMQMLCLMPDVVDDFSRVFRNQLEYGGVRLFQIPRSIALAYAVQPLDSDDISTYPSEFLCLDYDGEELIAVKIRCERNDSGLPVFVRMGRFPLDGKHPSYRFLAQEYINRYLQKYSVTLTAKMKRNLTETKLLEHVLLAQTNNPIILSDEGLVVDIWRDDDILAELQGIVLRDAQNIKNQHGIEVYCLCCFGLSSSELIFGEEALNSGCQSICARSKQHKSLWEEYLPSLQLDVNQDGAFASLELIGEKDRRQQIESAYLGKTVEIIVENGTIVLAANREHYDLPLEREVYGSMNREKLARFQPEEPLEEDTEVELRIHYTYGDVDSYKLIAITHEGQILESQWCDTIELDNPAPDYLPKEESITITECNRIRTAFDEFAANVNKPYAPFKSSIYTDRSNHSYSRYLYGLNSRYWPFFPIQNYFRKGNYDQVRDQIYDMLRHGIFGLVADVMTGALPNGHNLEAESNPFAVGDSKSAASVIKLNMREIARLFGMLYTLHDEQERGYPDIAAIIEAFRRSKSIEDWAPITAYVSRATDVYGIWDSFRAALYKLNPKRPDVYALRAISSVCYQTQEWIFEFYSSSTGQQDVDWLLKNIFAVLESKEWKDQKKLPYNPRKLRDVLELLLCICRLKAVNKSLLDCNSRETKELVKKLRVIDAELRSLQEQGLLKKEFNSRLGINLPYEYRRVNKVIYSLIQTLTGGGVINLIGFKEDRA